MSTFIIAHLMKVDIVDAYGEERLRRAETDNLIDFLLESLDGLQRGDRNGEDQCLGSFPSESSQRGSDACPRCDAIIDEDDSPALERYAGSSLQISFAAPIDFLELELDLRIDVLGGDAGKLGDIFVDHHLGLAAIDDCRCGELPLERYPDLAHEHDVEGRPEGAGGLHGDRDAA